MRPALQRLLSRPSSLDLLRCLVGVPVTFVPLAPLKKRTPYIYGGRGNGRQHTSSSRATAHNGNTVFSECSDTSCWHLPKEAIRRTKLEGQYAEKAQPARDSDISKASASTVSCYGEISRLPNGQETCHNPHTQGSQSLEVRRTVLKRQKRSILDGSSVRNSSLQVPAGEEVDDSEGTLDKDGVIRFEADETAKFETAQTNQDCPSISSSVASVVFRKKLIRRLKVREIRPASQEEPAEQDIQKLEALSQNRFRKWRESIWTHEELEFESDLDTPATNNKRLLDTVRYRNDISLWACLFRYRKRIYGQSGVLSFWKAMRRRTDIPTQGELPELFWTNFLALGFEDKNILDELCEYADDLYIRRGERWEHLYSKVILHFLVYGDEDDVLRWHRRLRRNHLPSPEELAKLCRTAILYDGNITALKHIYKQFNCLIGYTSIVPTLCSRYDFKAARSWHFFLNRLGDHPPSRLTVEPLMSYLSLYHPPQAVQLMRSLKESGISFASTVSETLEETQLISREMMNIIHGKTLNVAARTYNDALGARWFATTWVPLDIAIQTVHAIGVQEIGPLSLQAIAMRDQNAESITHRIDHLISLGISIGNSRFSRAVEYFARNASSDLLHATLHSDQHPDALEDSSLQEKLLASYARANDWTQYRKTLEVLSLSSRTPGFEKKNLMLRNQVLLGDPSEILHTLKVMGAEGLPVASKTIAFILQHTLQPRTPGCQPEISKETFHDNKSDDLDVCITIMKSVLRSGSYVPVTHWREIIRRLGMLGRFDDLRQLCLDLGLWYGPKTTTGSSRILRFHNFQAPTQITSAHPLHPLKMLFDERLQRAIVEWGFIHALKRRPVDQHTEKKRFMASPVTSQPVIAQGILLLRELNRLGIHINPPSVRKAIFNRLVAYYGSDKSSKSYNRIGQDRMHGKMFETASQLDYALGGRYFTGVDLRQLVSSLAHKKTGDPEKGVKTIAES